MKENPMWMVKTIDQCRDPLAERGELRGKYERSVGTVH